MNKNDNIEKMLIINWYDGPSDGILKVNELGGWFYFKLIDWDSSKFLRIFSMESINKEKAIQIINYYKSYEKPRWPSWVLQLTNVKEETLNGLLKKGYDILKLKNITEFIVLFDNKIDCIISYKNFKEKPLKDISYWFEHEGHKLQQDWFKLFNIERNLSE
jgi:hypothetical protein